MMNGRHDANIVEYEKICLHTRALSNMDLIELNQL